jgi:hypothetical protein
MLRSSWVVAQLAASQEGLSSVSKYLLLDTSFASCIHHGQITTQTFMLHMYIALLPNLAYFNRNLFHFCSCTVRRYIHWVSRVTHHDVCVKLLFLCVTFLLSLACRPVNLHFHGFLTKRRVLLNFKMFNRLFVTAYFKLPDWNFSFIREWKY